MKKSYWPMVRVRGYSDSKKNYYLKKLIIIKSFNNKNEIKKKVTDWVRVRGNSVNKKSNIKKH